MGLETGGELGSNYLNLLFIIYIIWDKIVNNHIDIDNRGAFSVPIIFGSDKTTVSVATGQTEYWPVHISIGNISNNVWCAHYNGIMLLGFLVHQENPLVLAWA